MGQIIEVNTADFQHRVIEQSRQRPVVVDFWAPWCGPCHMLAPVLERIAQEPNSNFVLAKVNVDNNPQLSAQYGVQGIPAVKAFVGGKIVDGFVGAQPKPMVRQFIQRVLSQAPAKTATAKPSMQVPRDPQARLDMARDLLRNGDGCRAQKVLHDFPPSLQSVEASTLLPLAKFVCEVNQQYRYAGSSEVEQLYRQAVAALRRREPSSALYQLLMAYHREAAEQQPLVKQWAKGIIELYGEGDTAVQHYQTQFA